MCRLWSVMFLFGVAVTVAVVEALSRVVEEDQERRRLNRELIGRSQQCPACLCTLGACRGHMSPVEPGGRSWGDVTFCPLCRAQGAMVTAPPPPPAVKDPGVR